MTIVILNFAHPLTDEQQTQLAALLGEAPQVQDIPSQVERERPLATIALDLAERAELSALEWQTLPLIINPPALAPVALALLGEINGRRGDFPPFLNIRPAEGSLPTRYEVAEIVNLQAIREAARKRR